jgi:hypothetical protein
MDLFFGSVSSLLSLLMRSVIENTLNDLVSFLDNYKYGNNDCFVNNNLSYQIFPFTCYLKPNRESGLIKIDPDFDETVETFYQIIDDIVESLYDMPRIEKLLFQEIQGVECVYYNMVKKNEELVVKSKHLIKQIITSNATGPKL